MKKIEQKEIDRWMDILNESIKADIVNSSNVRKLEVATMLAESQFAKDILRRSGYGWLGLSVAETAMEVRKNHYARSRKIQVHRRNTPEGESHCRRISSYDRAATLAGKRVINRFQQCKEVNV